MIQGLVQLFIFQALGELLSQFALPFIPGPVLGLVLLLAFLALRDHVPAAMDLVGSSILQHYVLDALRVTAWWQRGFALGVAAHGIGTSCAFSVNPRPMPAWAGVARHGGGGADSVYRVLVILTRGCCQTGLCEQGPTPATTRYGPINRPSPPPETSG